MKKEIKNKPASVKAKLMKISLNEKIDFDSLLLRYFQERFLYRCSISKYSDKLILKGGLLLICLNIPQIRATKDIDFLGENISNKPDKIEEIIKSIAELDYPDGVKFLASSIKSEKIREDADYEGLRIKIEATLGKAKKKIQIDIGFGDKVFPKIIKMNFPSLINENSPIINAYSLESVISEKFEAMVKLSMVNSRMKDFYDVYNLLLNFSYSFKILMEAVKETFNRRNTNLMNTPVIFQKEFHLDKTRQQQWIAFLNKSKLYNVNQSFSKIMEKITIFLEPIVISIKNKDNIYSTWNNIKGQWIK